MYNKIVKMVFIDEFVEVGDWWKVCFNRCYLDYKFYVLGLEVIEMGILEVDILEILFFMYDFCVDVWVVSFSFCDVCFLFYGCIDIVIVGDGFYFGG